MRSSTTRSVRSHFPADLSRKSKSLIRDFTHKVWMKRIFTTWPARRLADHTEHSSTKEFESHRSHFPEPFVLSNANDGFYPANTDTSKKPHHGAGGVSWHNEESSAKSSSVKRLA